VRHRLQHPDRQVHAREAEARVLAALALAREHDEREETSETEEGDEVEVEEQVLRVEAPRLLSVQIGALPAAALPEGIVTQEVAHGPQGLGGTIVEVAVDESGHEAKGEKAEDRAAHDAHDVGRESVQAHWYEHRRDDRPNGDDDKGAAEQPGARAIGQPCGVAEKHTVHAGRTRQQRDARVEHAAARTQKDEQQRGAASAKAAGNGTAEKQLA